MLGSNLEEEERAFGDPRLLPEEIEENPLDPCFRTSDVRQFQPGPDSKCY